MNQHERIARRDFLKFGMGLAALSLGGMGRALAAPMNDYKALVCVFLAGGNDGHNTIVPLAAGDYAAYSKIRGDLALPLTGTRALLPISAGGVSYGLHYGLTELRDLYNQGRMAPVFNVGSLVRPTTRAEIWAGNANLPLSLFSHPDQAQQMQSATPAGSNSGWGGRLVDALKPQGLPAGYADAVSVAGNSLFCNGDSVGQTILIPGTPPTLWAASAWPAAAGQARVQQLQQAAAARLGNTLVDAADQVMADGLALASAQGNAAALPASFGQLPNTDLGRQLAEIARQIWIGSQGGKGRQVFFCSLGGFDTHSAQEWQQWDLLREVSQAVAAFDTAMRGNGLGQQVTLFTSSDFGRSLQPSGTGSDHGWGNHHFVIGPVRSGAYGRLPTPALGGADDVVDRGVLIPAISVAQFGATLGGWFGASALELQAAFPTLSNFALQDIGFMPAG